MPTPERSAMHLQSKIDTPSQTHNSTSRMIMLGGGLLVLVALVGGCKDSSTSADNLTTAPSASATSGEQSPSPEAPQPTAETVYSAEDQAALDEIAKMSIDDIKGDFNPEDLDIQNIADTFSDPEDSPTTKMLGEQLETELPAFDVNAYVINKLASDVVSPSEKTELLKTLGLSPVALRDELIKSLNVANGKMDSSYPWSSSEVSEGRVVWRQAAASFYVVANNAIKKGVMVPAATEVDTVDDEVRAEVDEYTGSVDQTTNFGDPVNNSNVWIVRFKDGELVHEALTKEEALAASTYNVGGDRDSVPTPIDFLRIAPYSPVTFKILK